jgi:predicted nuclease of predicted toxin-antitoxin system
MPDKLHFLADECIGMATIKFLRDLGYRVVPAIEVKLNGKPDIDLLKYAIKTESVLLTQDLDFGNIILYPPKLHHGVIVLRYRHIFEKEIHSVLSKMLEELKTVDFLKTLIIVDVEKYRIRKE